MKTTKTMMTIAMVLLLTGLIAGPTFAKDEKTETYTVQTMADHVEKIQGQQITVEGTIVGACKSGCKMWIADGQYKEGKLFTLVRAKDDAFKFDTKKNGNKVLLTGYVVAKYKDYCGDDAEEGKKETESGEIAGSCKAPVKVETATKGDLEEMTFFATTVKYID